MVDKPQPDNECENIKENNNKSCTCGWAQAQYEIEIALILDTMYWDIDMSRLPSLSVGYANVRLWQWLVSNGDISNDLDGPLTLFSRSRHFLKSNNMWKTVHFSDKVTKNTNRKPYTLYRMVQLSMTLSDLWPRFQGHDIFRHWISQKRHEIEP